MIRLRFPLLALVLLACNRDKEPEPSAMATTTDSMMPAETTTVASFRSSARLGVTADTTRFVDSVRVGDTVSYERGFRVLMTVIESTWVRRPPVALGIPNGPFHLPIDSLCRQQALGYSGGLLNVHGPTVLRDLARVKACKGRVILGVLRSRFRPVGLDTGLNVARAKAEINSWPDIGPYIRDTTVIAIYMGDDILAEEWGKAPMRQRLARWDSIYALVHATHRWPTVATVIRAKPTELAQWGWNGRHLTTAWAQYRGPYRDRDPKEWVRLMVASARAQRLGLVIGLNVLDGGCGPPILPAGGANTTCLANVPGTAVLGTFRDAGTVRRFQVSPAEYLFYKTIFLAEPYNCASIDWQWSPVWSGGGRPPAQIDAVKKFHTLPGVKTAAKALGVVSRERIYTSCIHRS